MSEYVCANCEALHDNEFSETCSTCDFQRESEIREELDDVVGKQKNIIQETQK